MRKDRSFLTGKLTETFGLLNVQFPAPSNSVGARILLIYSSARQELFSGEIILKRK
jgi:hypothetical protein